MKQPIIQTENYLLVVGDSDIKEGDYFYYVFGDNPEIVLCEIATGNPNKRTNCNKIIGHLPLNNAPVLDGVPLLPELEGSIDVLLDKFLIERGEHPTRVRNPIYGEERELAKKCYQAATKVYSEEDMYKTCFTLWHTSEMFRNANDLSDWYNKHIKRIKQSSYPNWFIPEIEDVFTINKEKYIHPTGADGNYSTHDKEIKTTTNQQGQTVLVGSYEY